MQSYNNNKTNDIKKCKMIFDLICSIQNSHDEDVKKLIKRIKYELDIKFKNNNTIEENIIKFIENDLTDTIIFILEKNCNVSVYSGMHDFLHKKYIENKISADVYNNLLEDISKLEKSMQSFISFEIHNILSYKQHHNQSSAITNADIEKARFMSGYTDNKIKSMYKDIIRKYIN